MTYWGGAASPDKVESATPRTDAAAFLVMDQGGKVVSVEFARQLERELAEARGDMTKFLRNRLAEMSTPLSAEGRSLKDATLEELEQANALPSETPRTLAFYQSLDGGSVFEHLSKALDFARQLERELTVAQSASGELKELEAQRDDLASFVRSLVHKVRNLSPDSSLADRAMEYLGRKGLQGSILRSADSRSAK